MTTPISESKGIPPHAYSAHVEAVLAAKQAKHARRRRKVLYAVAVIVTAAALLILPGYAMACICLGLPSAILCAVLASSWRSGREYNKEHDLP